MRAARPTLLLTRPAEPSARFEAKFRERFGADWPVLIAPLTEIRFLPFDLRAAERDGRDLIFTSVNAVRAFARQDGATGRRAWCVGPATAAAARRAGFDALEGAGTGRALADRILREAPETRFLHPRGAEIAFDIAGALVSAGRDTVSVVVYEQLARAPDEAAQVLLRGADPVLLPLFSPRSSLRAAAALAGAQAPLLLAAISTAAGAAFGLPVRRRAIAPSPDADGMLAALVALIDAGNTG